MKLRTLALLCVGLVVGAIGAKAQTVFTWTGQTESLYYYNDSNWVEMSEPDDDLDTTQLLFTSRPVQHVQYYQIYVNKITFSGLTSGYFLEGNYDTTHIGDGGIVYAPAAPVKTFIQGGMALEATQTWDIQNGSLEVEDISDGYNGYMLTKTGAGTLILDDDSYNWLGGFKLSEGSVSVQGYDDGNVRPFGDGTLIFDGGTLITRPEYNYYTYYNYYEYVGLENPVESNGLIRTINRIPLILEGGVTLNATTYVDTYGAPLTVSSDISESGGSFGLIMTGTGRLILDGTNTYSGGTQATNGVVVFTTLQALPANPVTNALKAGSNGYIGLGDDGTLGSYNFQTAFIDRFDKAGTFGTIGFDTDPDFGEYAPTVFSDAIDLTGFGSLARLGSSTFAVLAGTITPQGTDYRFGGGGGYLEVSSQLTGARNVVVDSPAAFPLSLRLSATNNDFTGTVTVTNSALVFADIAQPVRSQYVTVGTGGYVGTESANSGTPSPDDADMATFLASFNLASTGVIGFDTPTGYSRNVTSAINLSSFTGPVYLGTSVRGYTDDGIYGGIEISGAITTANGGTAPYRFAGYKGGLVEVSSTLTGAQGVIIGDPNSPSTFGNFSPWEYGDPTNGHYSTVYLTGDNSTLTGDITLYGGQLAVGQRNGSIGTDPTSALGTGTIIVEPMTLPTAWTAARALPEGPSIMSEEYNIIIANNFMLNTTLHIGADSSTMVFSGKVSGFGGLYLQEYAGLDLTNDNNDFEGGIYLFQNSDLTLSADHASGSGMISFGGSSASIYFNSAAPVINGLASNSTDDYSYLYTEYPNAILTINQALSAEFQGEFRSDDVSDSLRVVKEGVGNLTLSDGGMYFHNAPVEASLPGSPQIGLQINQGAVTVGPYFYFEDSDVGIWVHGGTLTLNNNYSISSLVVVDNGGRLQGTGSLYTGSANSGAIFSSGGILSPGFTGATQIGSLGFDDLTLKGGAVMEITIKDPNGSPGQGWDYVYMTDYGYTLHIDPSVTPSTPFTLKLVSVDANGNPGPAVGFLDQQYTWTIFDASLSSIDYGGGSFNAAAFNIDTSLFSADVSGFTSLTGQGTFSFSQNGNLLQLNFRPVPEPSTYALLGGGLLAVGLAYRRRRRA